MSTGQVWLTNTLGGYMWSPARSEVLRVVAPTAGTTTDVVVLYGEVGRHETTRFVEQTNISKEN